MTLILAIAVVVLKYGDANLPLLTLTLELFIGLLVGVGLAVAIYFILSWILCCSYSELMDKILD